VPNSGEQRDDHLWNVRRVCGDSIAEAESQLSQGLNDRRHLRLQHSPRKLLTRPGVAASNDRHVIGSSRSCGKRVLRIVQFRIWEPPGTRHVALLQGDAGA
jgi:hypothetical protein